MGLQLPALPVTPRPSSTCAQLGAEGEKQTRQLDRAWFGRFTRAPFRHQSGWALAFGLTFSGLILQGREEVEPEEGSVSQSEGSWVWEAAPACLPLAKGILRLPQAEAPKRQGCHGPKKGRKGRGRELGPHQEELDHRRDERKRGQAGRRERQSTCPHLAGELGARWKR